ncbi:hypothetical protein [Puia dinghuensis]|uniref:hypothetical protein n=1 Tax=Puia dinghuensis TaxID=1792502 RepID=UPI00166D46AA|nr:hypothetical protein [Puia dinghuensis]
MHSFKTLLIFIVAAVCAVVGLLPVLGAGGGTKPRATKKPEGQMLLSFRHHTGRTIHHDSVLVIFDRKDRSGAGIIHGAYAMDSNHCILISRVPAGHYFVMVQCLGFHHDYWETTVWVRPQRCGVLRIVLEHCDEYIPGQAYIPPFKPASLTITSIRATGGARHRKSYPLN